MYGCTIKGSYTYAVSNAAGLLFSLRFENLFVQFSFSLGFGSGMTFSHMDIGELINLGGPPPSSSEQLLIEGAPVEGLS